MDYLSALEYIHGTHKFGSKLGLQNISVLLEQLGNPQKQLKFVHVAGTNGKGSTCAMINQILIEAGYSVGLYTSPYIEVFNERIRVNNVNISDDAIGKLTSLVKEKIEWMTENGYNHPTEFEVVTAIGLLYFNEVACDVVVFEVGLGGRLDATNVIDAPLVSVITPIDYDHMEFLGNTLEKIAFEKAGIIKASCPVVVHPQAQGVLQVFNDVCKERKASLTVVNANDIQVISNGFDKLTFSYKQKSYVLQLIAPYQADNAAVAIEAVQCLRDKHAFNVSDHQIYNGLAHAKWLARMEIIKNDPIVIIDGAHNLHGIGGLKKTIQSLPIQNEVVAIVGILADKDVEHMLDEILPVIDRFIVSQPNNPRAMAAEVLYSKIPAEKRLYCHSEVKEAVDYALSYAKENKSIVIGFGSLYLVGEIRALVR